MSYIVFARKWRPKDFESVLGQEHVVTTLKNAISQNRVAHNNFYNFANSYRNMYIGWITGAKTEATRRKRIDAVVKQSLLNKKLVTD